MTYSESKNLPKSQKSESEVVESIPVYLAGIDETPFDFVPDAETPEKCMQLKEEDWNAWICNMGLEANDRFSKGRD